MRKRYRAYIVEVRYPVGNNILTGTIRVQARSDDEARQLVNSMARESRDTFARRVRWDV